MKPGQWISANLTGILVIVALVGDWSFLSYIGVLSILSGSIWSIRGFFKKDYFLLLGLADVFVGIVLLTSLTIPYLWVIPTGKIVISALLHPEVFRKKPKED